jgi:kynureninase
MKSAVPKKKSLRHFEDSLQFAHKLDKADTLKEFRNNFHLPKKNGKPLIYFTGNSLGLQPKTTKKFIEQELKDWAQLGVAGHLHAHRPWVKYHTFAKKALAHLAGAKPIEVVAMNQLTVNLHLLMISFYRPSAERFKIITEQGAFSSDQYALESQLKFHSLDPEKALVELKPREGEFTLRTEDILQTINDHAPQLALVILGGVQYYTGQFFNIREITHAAHEAGAIAGFDLAHAIGNVVLNLHKDNVDFASWCSYKYLNSGPGAIAGAFVHEHHATEFTLPRFAGWWGHDATERFQMKKGFKPMPGADGWQLSNFPVLQGAAHLASLEILQHAGIKNIRAKSEQLTAYLEYLLLNIDPQSEYFQIITPKKIKERGCQLSLLMKKNGKKIHQKITASGVVADWREPSVIRIAPVPLYNTFEEVFRFSEILKRAL